MLVYYIIDLISAIWFCCFLSVRRPTQLRYKKDRMYHLPLCLLRWHLFLNRILTLIIHTPRGWEKQVTSFSRAQWKRQQLLQVISILHPETALDLNGPLTSVNWQNTQNSFSSGGNPAEPSFLPHKSFTLSITHKKQILLKNYKSFWGEGGRNLPLSLCFFSVLKCICTCGYK